MPYEHKKIEKKWQQYWEENETFYCDVHDFNKSKYYVLDMFPYPSGQGLHVGHPEGYTATDIFSRKKRMEGYNVLHPMGFDAFGLPAEQYAINTGNHPSVFTRANIDNFRRQIKSLGLSYDWSKEIATCDSEYYHWTQWIFTKLYERGLAYVAEMPVNWCEELGTVLANEEVIDGKSERGGYPVVRKNMRQWVLKITAYAESLLEDLELVDWPNSTKEMQKNWIGKSVGSNVIFKIKGFDKEFTVFTTRCDTLFGATYCVLSPEHPFVNEIVSADKRAEVEAYQKWCSTRSDMERTELNKGKTGVFTGAYAINPVNGKEIPIWISDYVLASYGTGAIMAVPAHDERDYAFARKFGMEIIPVLEGGDVSGEAFVGDGLHINSDFLNGLNKEEAITRMNEWLQKKGLGEPKVSYKLRDWLFSRQRYWGEPIPIIHLEDGTTRCVACEDLPLELPETDNFKPSSDGQSPLARCTDWLEVEVDGIKGTRETNTMPQWAGSCWYYLRYLDPHNHEALAQKELLEHWLPVDLYIGGNEHAVLHLLYARFWHKVLYDAGVLSCKEPFKKLFHQGIILGEDGQKMSKSRGNVVNPDEICEVYGADTLRIYEMFMGPLEETKPWNGDSLAGTRKWLDRVYRLVMESDKLVDENDHSLDLVYNQTVKKVGEDIDNLRFNTAISQMMIFVNECYKVEHVYKEYLINFIQMFACFAPHLGEELYQHLTAKDTVTYVCWPKYDESKLVADSKEVAVQVNGKLRAKLKVASDLDGEELYELALKDENLQKYIADKEIKKHFVIKGKVINIVI